MKKLITLFIVVLLGIATNAQDSVIYVQVLDSSIVQDTKLRIAKERLEALISDMESHASEEKGETGTILYKNETVLFLGHIKQAYLEYANSLLVVDTVSIDSAATMDRITEIKKWQTDVRNDTDIQEATSLRKWKRLNAELTKKIMYMKQLQK